MAGALFVIPSVFILWALSYVYVVYGNIPWIAAVFYGLKPAVLAIVAAAVIRIGRKALKNFVMWTIAAAAFVAIYFFHVPFPVIVVTAAVIGLLGGKTLPQYFRGEDAHPGDAAPAGKAADLAKIRRIIIALAHPPNVVLIDQIHFIRALLEADVRDIVDRESIAQKFLPRALFAGRLRLFAALLHEVTGPAEDNQ